MDDSYEELVEELNVLQATQGVDTETRQVIGILNKTISVLNEEINDLQTRVNELEKDIEKYKRRENNKQKYTWYSER